MATVEPISKPTPEIEAEVKAEAQVTVQPTINKTVPSNTPEPTPAVTPTSQPVITPAPTATPVPTPIPTLAPTPVPQFDISYWTGFAQDYAQSIGLVLESSAVDCWDNPIPAGAHCNNIEQNITDRLNRYKNLEGFTDVWIWSEDLGNGSYDIYIGYA